MAKIQEIYKGEYFFEPDPLLDWRAYGKILSSLNLYQKGGSGLTIYSIFKGMVNFFDYRLKMVRYALEFEVSKASREFKTTRKTVYKYLKRYKQEGLERLKNKPKKPKRIPHKMPKEEEEYILSLRDKHSSWGAKNKKACHLHTRLSLPMRN